MVRYGMRICFVFDGFDCNSNGQRHAFKSGGTNITVSETSRNFLAGGVPPTYAILGGGYNSYKKRHTESLSDSVATILMAC